MAGASKCTASVPEAMADSQDGRRRLRVLALGPQDAYPPVDGGKEGIFGLLSALSPVCDLSYAYPSAAPQVSRSGYERAGVHPLPVPWMPEESLTLVLGATCRLLPYKFEKYATAQAVAAFSSAIGARHFDAMLCLHAHTLALGERLDAAHAWRLPKLVREHNIEYEIVASYRRLQPPLTRVAAWPFEWLTRREERRIWKRADAVAFLSDHDLQCAQASGVAGRFVLAREGVPMPPFRAARHPGPNAPLLVLLNPKAPQSVANLREFLKREWQHAHSDPRLDGVALHVTGVTTEQLARLLQIEGEDLVRMRVSGLGFVPSLAGVLSSSLALVSPTYVGGGIRKKILEAMAHELPVIASQSDISSCSYFEPGRNVLPLGTVEDLCSSVARLRTDVPMWSDLSRAGRDTVGRFASWEQCAAVIVQELNVLSRRMQTREAAT